MSVGLISAPATWLNGTVAPPAWFQTIQDNVNGWISGTGFTMKSLQFDGSGAAASTLTADTPMVSAKNSAGNTRAVLVDHNGLFTMGRVSHRREEWFASFLVVGASTAIFTNNPSWFLTQAGAAAQTNTYPDTVSGSNGIAISPTNVNTNKSMVSSSQTAMFPSATAVSYVLECEAYFNAIGVNSITGWIGFSGSRDATAPASGFAWFKRASADTNWQCQTNDGATTNTVDSGVAPTVLAQRFRIEFHGSATPYAATTARFFINESLVATSVLNLPTANQFLLLGCAATGAGSGQSLAVSPVALSNNRIGTVTTLL